MRTGSLLFTAVICSVIITACNNHKSDTDIRQPVDTIGFAQYSWQVDSLMARIERLQPDKLAEAAKTLDGETPVRVAISPHDDYSYVGYLYPALFQHIKSSTVILFGVGHKAKKFGLEDKIVFGSYKKWKSPQGEINISELQESLMLKLPDDIYVINDSLQKAEHSLEALVPFLQYYNHDVTIIPVIVPAMPYDKMEEISGAVSSAIDETMKSAGLEWGKGWSIVISTDAVHYGNEDWGGTNYDRFGVDSAGYTLAVDYEKNIVNTMLAGDLDQAKIKAFSECTVSEEDYHTYKWTWCGRYAVPFGLLTAYKLSLIEDNPLTGIPVGYSTSIANQPVPVSDLGMGLTAPAKLTHWVGYAAVGYR